MSAASDGDDRGLAHASREALAAQETIRARPTGRALRAPLPPLVVVRGRILVFRLLDIGDEVSLVQAEGLIRSSPVGEEARRLRLSRAASMALTITEPPLDIVIGWRRLQVVPGRELDVLISLRVFDHGNLSVRFELPITTGTAVADLVPLCDDLYESELLSEEARRQAAPLLERLAPAIQGAHSWGDQETYAVTFIEELEGHPAAGDVLADDIVPRLLLGERSPRALSAGQLAEVRRHAYSYLEDDLVVVDWDSAFILEPSGNRDVADLLELGCAHLQSLRYYDQLLDQELEKIYDAIEVGGRGAGALLWSPYDKLARQVHERWLELTEVTERVETLVKVVGDFYLSRVYEGALDRFRIPEWKAAVYRKQDLIAKVYELLNGQIHTRRGFLLEVTVVLLILFEIVLALRGGH